MPVSKLPATGTPPRVRPQPRVGRLVPLEGITVREHPDRALLLEFLQELRLPLCAIDSFLELVVDQPVPEPVRLAIEAVADNVRHLGDLANDFREFTQLQADVVTPRPSVTSPLLWLDGIIATHAAKTAGCAFELAVVHRSFLPEAVEMDADLAAQALDAVVRVALYRAVRGPVTLRVSYRPVAADQAVAMLGIDVETCGGGFAEIDQGYAFAPFAASDSAHRPLLGLSVARRLCHLLGGELRLASRGPESCTYRVSIKAPPAVGAAWIDPLARSGQRLGCARPGRILLVEHGRFTQLLCSAALRRSGYELEVADTVEQASARLVAAPELFLGLVLDTAVPGLPLQDAVSRVRALGYAGPILACHEPDATPAGDCGVDASLQKPMSSHELIEAITRLRAPHSDDRNATSAR